MSKPFQPIPAYVVCIGIVLHLASCKPTNDLSYFQTIRRDTALQQTVSRNFDLKIAPDDLLTINISSTSPELSALFNASQGSGGSAGVAESSTSGYLVDKKGTIQLYKLGDVKAAGLTKDELKDKLQKDLSPYLKDPVVTVRFANHRVTVLGEVANPGVLPLVADQLTVLEALGRSGDLTENGKRENILVIRKTETGKEFRHLNLLDHSVFTSPYYYLQNEDVVYVEPDIKKKVPQNKAQVVSYILSGLTVLTFLLSRIK